MTRAKTPPPQPAEWTPVRRERYLLRQGKSVPLSHPLLKAELIDEEAMGWTAEVIDEIALRVRQIQDSPLSVAQRDRVAVIAAELDRMSGK